MGILGHGVSLASAVEYARSSEQAGFDSVWIGEYYHHGYIIAAATAVATNRLAVGTAVTLAFPRTPLVTALAALDLAELTGNRFVLGLGSQVKTAIERWHGLEFSKPAARIADYIRAVRAIVEATGATGPVYEGEFYHYDLRDFGSVARSDLRVPVLLAAVRPTMIRAAADAADGVLGHIFWSDRYVAEVVDPIVSEHRRDPFALNASIVCAISAEDPDSARQDARRTLAFYASTRTYFDILAADGFATDAAEARAALQSRDERAMERAISDRMLETYALAGSPEDVADQLAGRARALDTAILVPAHHRTPPERVHDQYGALFDAAPMLVRAAARQA